MTNPLFRYFGNVHTAISSPKVPFIALKLHSTTARVGAYTYCDPLYEFHLSSSDSERLRPFFPRFTATMETGISKMTHFLFFNRFL